MRLSTRVFQILQPTAMRTRTVRRSTAFNLKYFSTIRDNINGASNSTFSDGFYGQMGKHVFKGDVSAPYLKAQGLDANILDDSKWVKDKAVVDKVASSLLAWARDNGGFTYCHWFQPLGASYVRHGQAAQAHNSFVRFDNAGKPVWELKGKSLLQSETDGSSFPNGGLRATHSSGAYLAIDPTSPIFLRGDTVYIPACMCSFNGDALDEKTPLLRASDALYREGKRLLKNLGYEVEGVVANIGLEQEFFFVPRDAYARRPDLQATGRTLFGRVGPRGQELSDHYMAPLSYASPALACMREVQEVCYKIGIPLRTRHREVAPNQFEFAPMYGSATVQIDQNLNVMQIVDEIAKKHGLVAIFQEKPFDGVNGSGKHNNWSLATDKGVNLLNLDEITKESNNDLIFPLIMAALVKATDTYGDLMRMSIACPGNDFRLGACEAPPAIISMYLGDDMTKFLKDFKNGKASKYTPGVKVGNFGASAIPQIEIPPEDRNRTSPFPYSGHRFEFRAVGASQNVSLTNTVLATIAADAFSEFSKLIEYGVEPKKVAQNALKKHWKVIFNGNGYDVKNQTQLTKKGLWRIDNGVDAIVKFTVEKNVKLFSKMGVFSKKECQARQNIMLSHYIGCVEMEAHCLIDMVQMQILPLMKSRQINGSTELEEKIVEMKHCLDTLDGIDLHKDADSMRTLRLTIMEKVRREIEEIEGIVDPSLWPFASYKDLLFLDYR